MQTQLNRRKRNPAVLYLLPAIIIMVLMLGFPIAYNLILSLFKWLLKYQEHPFVGFENFYNVMMNSQFLSILKNTLVWTLLGVVLQMIIGIGLAMFVDNMTKGQKLMRILLLVPWIIPGVVTALMWKFMLQSDIGLINYMLQATGLTQGNVQFLSDTNMAMFTLVFVNTWKAVPFWFLMITAGLQSKPEDQIEAARLDGASAISVFFRIILPSLTPVILSTAVLTSIWTLNYFDIIWVITRGGPVNTTTTLPIYIYKLAFEQYNFGESAACAVISLLIVTLISIPYVNRMFKNMKEEGML